VATEYHSRCATCRKRIQRAGRFIDRWRKVTAEGAINPLDWWIPLEGATRTSKEGQTRTDILESSHLDSSEIAPPKEGRP